MTFCPHCGRELSRELAQEGRFCPYCGKSIEILSQPDDPHEHTSTVEVLREELVLEELLTDEDREAVEALPAGSALLVTQRGAGLASRFLLDTDQATLGRHTESDIFLDDVTVSRRHAVITRDADGFLVRDLGSLNGTYRNREMVEEARLNSGDELQVGKFRLLFFSSPVGLTPAGEQ